MGISAAAGRAAAGCAAAGAATRCTIAGADAAAGPPPFAAATVGTAAAWTSAGVSAATPPAAARCTSAGPAIAVTDDDPPAVARTVGRAVAADPLPPPELAATRITAAVWLPFDVAARLAGTTGTAALTDESVIVSALRRTVSALASRRSTGVATVPRPPPEALAVTSGTLLPPLAPEVADDEAESVESAPEAAAERMIVPPAAVPPLAAAPVTLDALADGASAEAEAATRCTISGGGERRGVSACTVGPALTPPDDDPPAAQEATRSGSAAALASAERCTVPLAAASGDKKDTTEAAALPVTAVAEPVDAPGSAWRWRVPPACDPPAPDCGAEGAWACVICGSAPVAPPPTCVSPGTAERRIVPAAAVAPDPPTVAAAADPADAIGFAAPAPGVLADEVAGANDCVAEEATVESADRCTPAVGCTSAALPIAPATSGERCTAELVTTGSESVVPLSAAGERCTVEDEAEDVLRAESPPVTVPPIASLAVAGERCTPAVDAAEEAIVPPVAPLVVMGERCTLAVEPAEAGPAAVPPAALEESPPSATERCTIPGAAAVAPGWAITEGSAAPEAAPAPSDPPACPAVLAEASAARRITPEPPSEDDDGTFAIGCDDDDDPAAA